MNTLHQTQESEKPRIEITSQELGVPEGASIKEYIAAAKVFHNALKQESETGKPVIQPQLEKPVRFSRKGFSKNASSGANAEKWLLFPMLRDIIETSTLVRSIDVDKNAMMALYAFTG